MTGALYKVHKTTTSGITGVLYKVEMSLEFASESSRVSYKVENHWRIIGISLEFASVIYG